MIHTAQNKVYEQLLKLHDKKWKFPIWKSNIFSLAPTLSNRTRTTDHFYVMFYWLEAKRSLPCRVTCEFSAYVVDKPHSAVFFLCWHKNIKFCQKEMC